MKTERTILVRELKDLQRLSLEITLMKASVLVLVILLIIVPVLVYFMK